MKRRPSRSRLLAGGLLTALSFTTSASGAEVKVLPPTDGVYHGVFADLPEFPAVGDVTRYTQDFERLVGKSVALTVVGNEWTQSIRFPTQLVTEARNAGQVPVVQIRPWSSKKRFNGQDSLYQLQKVIDGNFDQELRAYAKSVRDFGKPVMLSFAPEANGNWYPWSGIYAGADTTTGYGDPVLADGPERYRDAHRHFINIFRQEKVENVTWVFHISSTSNPKESWNDIASYYPGNEYIDWLAVSVYSAQVPGDLWDDFTEGLDAPYNALTALSDSKPIAVLEYGTIEDSDAPHRKADWMTAALTSIKEGWYPRVKALTYWHESSWLAFGNNNLRVDSSQSALHTYRSEIVDSFFVGNPVFNGDPNPTSPSCVCGWVTYQNNRYCAIWKPGDAFVKEQRLFSECSINVCTQLFSRDTVQNYCGGKVSMFQR